MNSLYPIIRRVRRALLPPDDIAPVAPPAVVEPSSVVAPVEVVTVEMAPVVSEVLATPPVVATADQSLLTSAATKATKGQRVAVKSRVKAADEAHSTQP